MTSGGGTCGGDELDAVMAAISDLLMIPKVMDVNKQRISGDVSGLY